MKHVISALALLTASATAWSHGDNVQSFNNDWKFTLTDSAHYSQADVNDSTWRTLQVPHDWSREGIASPTYASCTGYLPGGIGWYRKHFDYHKSNENTLTKIYFEGIYNRSKVYLNGHLVGSRPNGYVSTEYDLTPWLKEGDNVIAVKVDHSKYADSRWYTGSGIYRNVWLYTKPQHHIDLWGVKYNAIIESANKAKLNVDVIMAGTPDKKNKLKIELFDQEGHKVATKVTSANNDTCKISLQVNKPKLWSIDSPYLYKLKASLLNNGTETDSEIVPVGFRTISFDADNGFKLNGKSMKLKGVCLHHDAGVLGAAVPPIVVKNRLKKLKEIGVNAIRCSHNPQAPIFYDYCDSLGLMVMDEGSDEWEFPKRKWVQGWNVGTPSFDGTYDFFEEWIERDVTDMVRRDRNHPSIILWSVGNEVDYPNDPYSHPVLNGDYASGFSQPMFGGYNPDAPNAERIGFIAQRLAKRIREADKTRPVTGALAGVYMSNQTIYPDVIDVVGYNYTESRYKEDHAQYPNRIIYGSENGSNYEAWTAVRDNDFISGQFIWTGTDYLGESGRWPSRGLGTGLLDFSNHAKPRGIFRQSLWSDKPMAYIGTYRKHNWLSLDAPALWNYNTGDSVRVVCYTNAHSATLYLNDKEVGQNKEWDKATGLIYWDIAYEPGKLTVKAANESGEIVASHDIFTLTRPNRMNARLIDKDATHAIVELEVFDDNGNLCTLADNKVWCLISGGRLLGLENGSNNDMSDYKAHERRFHNGTITVYVELDDNEPTTLTFRSPLLNTCSLTID